MISKNDAVLDYFSDIATPLDTLEQVAKECSWPFERVSEHALTIDIEGRWAQCTLKFEWMEENEALRFSVVSDLKVQPVARHRIAELLMDVNAQCNIGHFILSLREKTVTFTHTSLMRGIPFSSLDSMETLVDAGITEFDRFYPTFRSLLNGTSPANVNDCANFSSALFNTVGEA